MSQGETSFKRRALRDLKKIPRCWFIKTQERGRKGVPDVLACIRGKFFAIELKKDGEKATPLQIRTLKAICDADGISFETTPSEWGSDLEWLKSLG